MRYLRHRFFLNNNTLRNGGIIVGGYTNYTNSTNAYSIPFKYCVTSSGGFKWIHYFLHFIESTDYSFESGYVTNIVEKENGDLYVFNN